jgi:hypothetical protein
MVPLFRMYNPRAANHFYTTSASERDDAVHNFGYQDDGIAGYVYTFKSRSASFKTRRTTWATETRGLRLTSSREQPGTVPFRRAYQPTSGDHFYTMSNFQNAVPNLDYEKEGITGYVPLNETDGGMPLYNPF